MGKNNTTFGKKQHSTRTGLGSGGKGGGDGVANDVS
jgi:hypothetical protein